MWTPSEQLRWKFAAAVLLFDGLGCLFLGLAISPDVWLIFLEIAALAAFGLFYRIKRNEPRVAHTFISLAQLGLYTLALCVASYVIVRFNRPFIDDVLYHLDKLLGFDWFPAFVAANKMPWLSSIMITAYNSSPVQIVLITVFLGLTLATERLEKFLEAFMIGGVITLSLWAIYPSFGAATYAITAGLTNAMPGLADALPFVKPQLALLSGEMTTIEISKLQGIVGAPSFHTVMALVSVYAFKDRGIWFVLMAGWNIIVICSVPVFGCHHLIDVFAGAAVALTAIALAERLAAARAGSSNGAVLRPIAT